MAKMDSKLSAHDRQDLEKYTKFLAIKATQIIVNSRLGEPVSTNCKPLSSGTDWFNLAIPDLPEVSAQTRSILSGSNPCQKLPICVEISLKTSEGDSMILETWLLNMGDPTDHATKVTHTIYNRMSLLLKSLLAVTRVTPAYKLSRRQGADSYLICYRIYSGEPQLQLLGEGHNQARVGQLTTPLGTIQLSVAYRTKMTISPQHTKDIMVKSDHFNPDLSPKHTRYQNIEDSDSSLSSTIKAGAFADPGSKRPHSRLFAVDSDEVPFANLLITASKQPAQDQNNATKSKPDNNGNNNAPAANPVSAKTSSDSVSRRSSSSATDDFIMVDLKTPFAGGNLNSDLGTFYRECQTAPPLKTFLEQPTLAEQVSALPSQLAMFEKSQAEFDALVTSLISQPSLT
ncbi:autophagy-related protein 13 homolog [Neocloeon triangulifer]|uniref:autophagy-related protein 13 homolog n=1 Tax=Neocloeon triangulifer TaxID=2078957 RepID=UPI00286EB8FD|nr:autophagy-related protein 13 homolog [Neocloeon triangulifer]